MKVSKEDAQVVGAFIILFLIWAYKKGLRIVSDLFVELKGLSFILIFILLLLAALAFLRSKLGRGKDLGDAVVVSAGGCSYLTVPLRIDIEGEGDLDFSRISEILEDMGVGMTLIVNRWPGRSLVAWKQEGTLYLSGLIWRRLGDLNEARSMIKAAISALNSSLEGLRMEIDYGAKADPELFSMIMSFGEGTEKIPSLKKLSKDEGEEIPLIELGESSGRSFGLTLQDLTRHVLIVGQTGSGKTTTAKRIVYEAWNLGIPSLILDIHWEYKGLVFQLGGRIFSTREGMPPICINPLSGFNGREDTYFLIAETLSSMLDLTPSQFYLLSRALRMVRDLSPEKPTLEDLVEVIRSIELSSHAEEESKASLLRKIEPLTSPLGTKLFGCDNLKLEVIKEAPSLIEMGDVESDIMKKMATFFILKRIKDSFIKEEGKTDHPRLLIVIEEAEKLLPDFRDATGMDIVDRLFSELRKFGASLVLVSQNISEISEGIIRNAGTKILHRIDSPSDVKAVKSLISDRNVIEKITRLSLGECVVTTPKHVKLVRVSPPEEDPVDPLSINKVIANEQFYFS